MNSKQQSLIVTGIGLILISVVILYFSLSQPRVSVATSSTTDYLQQTNQSEATSINIDDIFEDDDTTCETEQTVSQQVVIENETVEQTTISSSTSQTTKKELSGKININTCTEDDLTLINGIGDSRASAIIQYREYLGEYTSVEQIKNIKGIGDKLYEKIAPYLTV